MKKALSMHINANHIQNTACDLVSGDKNEWRKDGTWKRLNAALRGELREEMGRNREPSAGIADSQSVKTTSKRGRVATMEESP